jgi:branched-chain amino acid transport system permease protein
MVAKKRKYSPKNLKFVCGTITVLLFLTFPILINSDYLMTLATEILILGLFATSLNLLIGYTGLVSFGHAGYFGIGAYSIVLLLQKTTIAFPFAMIFTIVISAFAGLLIGFLCIRVSDIYFAFLTLAFGEIIYVVIVKWESFTNGHSGLVGGFQIPTVLDSTVGFYIFTLLIVILSLLILSIILASPFGWVLRGIRDNTERVTFLGVNADFHKLLAFTISSGFSGLAGALIAVYSRGAFPEYASFWKNGEAFFMILVGGLNSFLGPIFGAGLLKFLKTYISAYTLSWELILGIILVFLAMFFRQGFLPWFQDILEKIIDGFKKEI